MSSEGPRRRLKLKHIFAIAISTVVLAAVFVPFQHVEAFSLDVNIPSSIVKSPSGSEFSLELEVHPGELISFETVTIVLDEGPLQQVCTFDDSGAPVGTCDMIDSLNIDVSTGAVKTQGYAFGYGQVASGPVGSGHPSAIGNIGNNLYSYVYSYGLTDYVEGYVGPATITFTGLLNTESLSTGTHSIQASIDTGAAGTNNHLISNLGTFVLSAPSSSDVDVHVRSKLVPDNVFFTGMQIHIKEPLEPVDDVSEKFTETTFTEADGLVAGEHYIAYATEFGPIRFDHWEDGLGNTVTEPFPGGDAVNGRGTEFVAGTGVELVAVYHTVASAHANVNAGLHRTVDIPLGGGIILHANFGHITVPGILNADIKNPNDLSSILNGVNSHGIHIFTVNGEDVGIIGDIIDLDFTGSFEGDVTFTFTYDPSLIDSFDSDSDENDVVAGHFAGGDHWEVCGDHPNQGHNTIDCTTDSLSPFTVGVVSSVATGGNGGHGGGNGGSIGNAITFPASYFDLNPLLKILIQSTTFLNAQGQGIFQAQVGEQVEISNLFTNYQQVDQNYAFIVEITDQNGVATDLGWQNGEAPTGKTVSLSRSWTPQEAGIYTVKIFVWDDVNDAPAPLSGVTVKTIRVTE